jgi:hypothetical protein
MSALHQTAIIMKVSNMIDTGLRPPDPTLRLGGPHDLPEMTRPELKRCSSRIVKGSAHSEVEAGQDTV